MTEQAKKYLSDMLMAIELVERFSEGTTTFEAYQADLNTWAPIA